jgi:hypothetical protein
MWAESLKVDGVIAWLEAIYILFKLIMCAHEHKERVSANGNLVHAIPI